MKLSIVLATYNGEKFISELLDSIVNQTRQPDEIVVVDDCSKDNTMSIVNDFKNRYKWIKWSVFYNDYNMGYKKNFYKALSLASGDVMFLCDQDDVWINTKLEYMSNIMEVRTEIGVLSSAVSYIDKNDNPIYVPRVAYYSNNNLVKFYVRRGSVMNVPFRELFTRNITPGCTICVRRKEISKFLDCYNESLPHDWYLMLLSSLLYDNVFFINFPLIRYRLHDNNTIGVGLNKKSNDGKYKKYCLLELQSKFLESLNTNKYDSIKLFVEKRKKFYKKPSFSTFCAMLSDFSTYLYAQNWRQSLIDIKYLMKGQRCYIK